MKLDFSTLAQPAAKARGQVGTTGTPASMRVCASPLAHPGAGTTGDEPAAVALVADFVVAAHGACPPASPASPRSADNEKSNAGAASPVSPLVPVESAQGAAAIPCEREDVAGGATGAGVNTCVEPVAAALPTAEEAFGVVWPPEGHKATCPAYTGLSFEAAQDRPYRLAPAESDVAHADPWDDGAIARFVARVGLFLRRGFDATDADDLAERLHLRDVGADYRHLCLECAHYRPGRCGSHRAAGLMTEEIGRDLATMLQNCPGFDSAR